jgi:hypothetical protein
MGVGSGMERAHLVRAKLFALIVPLLCSFCHVSAFFVGIFSVFLFFPRLIAPFTEVISPVYCLLNEP